MNTVVQRTAAAPHPATPKRSGSGAPRSAPRAPGIDRILLDRDRLLAQDEGRPVLVVEGPSGYGKTVLAEMWLERQRTQLTCCWVSIDAASCDPVLFLEQLLRAVGAENPGRPEGGIDDEAARAERFALLCSRLDEEPRGFCIVIDDAHVLADSPSLTYLANLLDIASAKLRIGLTMQPGKIAVGLGPMTARGQASWIQAKHLALTREECEAFARLRGQNLSASQADWLFRATEGWPVLTLLALAAPLDPSPDDVAAVTGSGPLRSYIYERFVRGLSPDDQAVLFALSCLGSAPLALLTALEPAPARVELALIHFRSLGIVQNRDLDEGSVISLHALVREAAGRLVDPGPDRSRDALIREAAEWYWRNGSGAAAVRLALDAGPSLANLSRAWLIELGFGFIFRSGQHQTYLDLVERYESVSGAPDPEIDQTAAWALIFQRQFALAESRMTRIERSGVERLIDTVPLQRSVMLSLRDNYVQGGELSLRWIRTHAGQHTFDMGVASMVSAFSAKCLGCFDDAHVALREGMYCFNVAQSAYGIGWSHVVGAIVLAQAGRYRAALAQVEGGLTRCPASQGFGSLRTLLRGIEAFLRYERNETERVRELLGEVLPFMADQGVVDAMILGFAAAARARASAGDYGTALDILSEGELIGLQREFPRLTYGLRAERALLLLRNGAANQARPIVEGLVAGSGVRTSASLLQARLALAGGDGNLARACLAPILLRARTLGRQSRLCEILLQMALTEELCGSDAAAYAALSEALEIGSAEGYVRTFLDEGQTVRTLIERWIRHAPIASRPAASLAQALLKCANTTADRGPANPAASANLSFNKRERQILSLLNEGLSNAQLAKRCFISEGTVKWYLHNLYEKLGVGNRTAVLRAVRDMGIGL